jgi:hypothetical protein
VGVPRAVNAAVVVVSELDRGVAAFSSPAGVFRLGGLMRVSVAGGCGFIGSAMCRRLIRDGIFVVNVDKLTYAANPKSLASIAHKPSYAFERADICDRGAIERIFGPSAFDP